MDFWAEKTVAEIISRLKKTADNHTPIKVAGTWGSFAPMLAAHISQQTRRPILYISGHIDDADKVADDLHTFGADNVCALPAWEDAENIADATDQIRAERLRITLKLSDNSDKLIIPAPTQALCQPIPKPDVLKNSSLELGVEKTIAPEDTIAWLIDNGFERVDRIDLPGQFAHRGGIIDIYAPLVDAKILLDKSRQYSSCQAEQTIRVEFFGDTIESIRQINLDTHLSTEQIKTVSIISAVCGTDAAEAELFINILPKNTIIILAEPGDIEDIANVFVQRAENVSSLYSWATIYKAMSRFTQLHICRFAGAQPEDFLKLNVTSAQQFQQKSTQSWAGHKESLDELVAEARGGKKVLLYCEREAEIKRVTEIITQTNKKVPANFKLLPGFINQGFIIKSLQTIIVTHHELFGQFAVRRKLRPSYAAVPVDTLGDLQAGDYVVHLSYGIGKFLGIKTIKDKAGTSEYLTLEYADSIKIHVAAANITLVQKYIGTSLKRPKLSKIGSKKWQTQKEKVARSIQSIASQLLEVQAKRKATGGIAFGPDSNWQGEFEESFPYTETADQTTAIQQIKTDMCQAIAMDRLLCGDVGYGKTELAMRAAFKAVDAGKQVAILVPTTVLCVQHGRSFTERFADFPVCIEILNRFKTAGQAADIIERTRKGRVDILIGTHRLLSGDVGFKDLGLLVIDEEQRFGVEHKEKLKKFRYNVDVLTMTATPIPRTLHMSLLGLRDISSLATPPLDRRSIVTSVTAYSADLIKKTILRELNRQGQVFFLHNRVKTIDKKAWEIRKMLGDTDVKIAVAHGQMPKSELERTMIDFVTGNIDVLVCTTIIESGLDIPNANTILIDNADRFGLAELHQLRGRVGRYKHRAYAYMLLPTSRTITPIAARRLKAIEEYSHLGAGFRIALRDLEIRGAGNVLGAEQSGHIQIVGYQMYCELLAAAVRKLKGQPAEAAPASNIDLGFTTYLPKAYIAGDRHRMEVYRKIAVAKTSEDLEQLETELTDVYGPVPEEVKLLLELAGLRIAAGDLGIKAIVAAEPNLVFSFAQDTAKNSKSMFANVAGKVNIIDAKTIYLHLPKNYFEPATMLNVLRKLFGTSK